MDPKPLNLQPPDFGTAQSKVFGVVRDSCLFCSCHPPGQAVRIKCSRATQNNGKWAWVCPNRSRRCEFFMLEEAIDDVYEHPGLASVLSSKVQEGAARPAGRDIRGWLVSRQKNEQGGAQDRGDGPIQDIVDVSSGEEAEATTLAGPVTPTRVRGPPGTRRMLPPAIPPQREALPQTENVDDDEYPFSSLDSEEERQLAQISFQAATLNPSTTTPTKRAGESSMQHLYPKLPKISHHAASSAGLYGLPTPDTRHRSGETITFREISPTNDDEMYKITKEVMTLLKDQNVDQQVLSRIRGVLDRDALKTRGIIRGRDMVRSSLKMKDDKIAALQARVRKLEHRSKTEEAGRAEFKAGLMDIYRKI